jgi:hypothetical protein
MSSRKAARPANHKVRKSRASVSSAKSRRRTTKTPKQEHPESASEQVRVRTADEIANEQTVQQLALRVWAALFADKVLSGMSALMDELIHQLHGGDKEGSRQLALHLFSTAQALLTRKRDHGRADAALIALSAGAPIKPNAAEIVIRLADRENSYA